MQAQQKRHQNQRKHLARSREREQSARQCPAPTARREQACNHEGDTQYVRVCGESDLLHEQRTPRVEQHPVGFCHLQQHQHHGKVDRRQHQLQWPDLAGCQDVSQRKKPLVRRAIDCCDIRVVYLVENRFETVSKVITCKVGRGGNAVGRTGLNEQVAVPQVAVEVVLENRLSNDPDQSEHHREPEHPADRHLGATVLVARTQCEAQSGTRCDNHEKRDQRRLAARLRGKREVGVSATRHPTRRDHGAVCGQGAVEWVWVHDRVARLLSKQQRESSVTALQSPLTITTSLSLGLARVGTRRVRR